VKEIIRSPDNARIPHEFILSRSGNEKGAVPIQRLPVQAVRTVSEMQTILTVAFEI
jgi:hypothetical protein